MDDLVAWLRQHLDEDERLAEMARLGASGVWKVSETDLDTAAVYYGDGPHDWPNTSSDGIVVYDEGAPTSEQTEHIARWDPARVLREVEAKRQLLALRWPVEQYRRVITLKILALPYSDRPGWREEWRP